MVSYGKHLRPLSIATVLLFTVGLGLAFFYAPMDADQGFRQKIFYLHVPLAIVAMGGFIAGAVAAIMFLRTSDSKWDLRSYTWIHWSLILALAALITGSIWAKTAWGHWWVWDEPTLVSFLIVFLLYCTYQPLRFSIEDRDKQARYAAVFAITAGAFVPLNFMAVRMAKPMGSHSSTRSARLTTGTFGMANGMSTTPMPSSNFCSCLGSGAKVERIVGAAVRCRQAVTLLSASSAASIRSAETVW